LRFQRYLTAHPLHSFADERQSNYRTGINLSTMQSIENLENTLMIFWSNANPVVFYPQTYTVSGFFSPDSHLRERALRMLIQKLPEK
jgi:hypothetical protein